MVSVINFITSGVCVWIAVVNYEDKYLAGALLGIAVYAFGFGIKHAIKESNE